MNWTKTSPTRPGAYWWRHSEFSQAIRLAEVYKHRELMVCGYHIHDSVEQMHGEWCGPLVPVEEVDKAWNEGFVSGRDRQSFGTEEWKQSRARRVVEGEEL